MNREPDGNIYIKTDIDLAAIRELTAEMEKVASAAVKMAEALERVRAVLAD